jgi:hypothetical protein
MARWALWAVCASVVLAGCDIWTAQRFRRTWLSVTTWKMKDGGSTGHVGFLYTMVFWRSMDGEYGPELWFWFSPLVIDAAHGGVTVRWVWAAKAGA